MNADDALIRVHHGDDFPEGLWSPDVYFLPGYGQASSIAQGASGFFSRPLPVPGKSP
jgi:hypothetical protein